ncbi:hypothetical protein ICA_02805 [Bacillus cereus BAG1O-3]|uniref:Helix-turn-helix domain containing protein n=2 Tax=Bacillus cereus group TaxID=86661 RepID=A0A9X7QJD2_BACCE|nr:MULTISPECIES: hypothetical protein [Bacillus cereus group]EPF11118.1 hypothetical protein ICA_02805 [Bacillus cereus BAG1O-3]MDR4413732.1 hypothetical protein [Bacillus thuringiensis]PFF75834.1 hypothetical protein CN341_19760 [Bacillus cereus]PGX81374.1 hypothetical protein COE45_16445 [Bacillus thuringiensis]QDZ73464.1 hypothetical protein D0437_10255 [Bacillus cereus]
MEADYIMLEQFNHGWSYQQINDFREMWKAGISVENISKVFKRKPQEVILLVYDQAEKRKVSPRSTGLEGL